MTRGHISHGRRKIQAHKMGTRGNLVGNLDIDGNGKNVHIGLLHGPGWLMGPQWWRAHARL